MDPLVLGVELDPELPSCRAGGADDHELDALVIEPLRCIERREPPRTESLPQPLRQLGARAGGLMRGGVGASGFLTATM
jgi:hypothetical protein